jgi:hypothetical protein
MYPNGLMENFTYDQGIGTQQPWQEVSCQIEVAQDAQKH